MHSSLTPSVDGAECVQWTMNHDPESLESRGSKFILELAEGLGWTPLCTVRPG